MVIHGVGVVADQLHSRAAVTWRLPDPPEAPTGGGGSGIDSWHLLALGPVKLREDDSQPATARRPAAIPTLKNRGNRSW